MLKSVRIILAITVYFDYDIWQMDVELAFLNKIIAGDVQIIQSDGFVNPTNA
jgi:hypothetical protein